MATLADILVTLTLDTEEFNRNLQQVSRNIQQMSGEVQQHASSMANNFSQSTQHMSDRLRDVGYSSRYLARNLGTDTDSMNRVLRASQEEFDRYGQRYAHVSMAIREQFMGLPSHLMRYVQALHDAGQSTEGFYNLAQQYGARVIQHLAHENEYLQQKTSQSMRLMQSFANDTNLAPLTNGFLRLGHNMEMTARQGTVLNLALQRIGTNNSLKNLHDQMMFIQQGIMRARGAFLAFGIAGGLAIYGMIKLASAVDERVNPAFERMKSSLVGAMQPFIHAFATAMVAVMNFVSKLADMVKVFSQAHPIIFNMIMSIMMLTLVLGALLAPLAVTGIWAEGVAASFSALWMIISPFVLGVLAVIGVAMALATALVVLWVSIQNLWTNSEAFRNAFIGIWNSIKDMFFNTFLTPVLGAWENLKTAFMGLVATFTGGTTSMSGIWTMLGNGIATVVTFLAGQILPMLQMAFSFFGTIVTAVINGVITAINWMGQMWQQHGAEISAVTSVIWGYIQQAFTAIASFIMSIMPQIISVASSGWELIKTAVDFCMKYIAPVVVEAFNIIWQIIQFVMPFILQIIVSTWNNIKSAITSAIAIIQNVIQLFTNILKGNWSGAWENVKAILSNALTLIWNLIQIYFAGKLLAPLKGFATQGLSIVKACWTGILNAIRSVCTSIASFCSSIWNAIASGLRGNFSGILSSATSIFNSMRSSITSIFNSIKSVATSVFNAVKSAITNPIETAKNTLLGIIGKIVSAFASMKIVIPKPKLPKVDIGVGHKSIGGIDLPYPTFSVSWNAKGNIFNGASVLGGGQGVGEAGAEAVLPIQHKRYMQPFASAVASNLEKSQGSSNANTGSNQYNIHFNEPVVIREDADIQRIVDELERRRRISERAKGVFSY